MGVSGDVQRPEPELCALELSMQLLVGRRGFDKRRSHPSCHAGAPSADPSADLTSHQYRDGLFRHRHAGGTSAHALPAAVGSFVAALAMWVRAVVTPVALRTADSMQASCSAWASQGMCNDRNRNYVLSNCPRSCCLAAANVG